jgi:hypothetical protein
LKRSSGQASRIRNRLAVFVVTGAMVAPGMTATALAQAPAAPVEPAPTAAPAPVPVVEETPVAAPAPALAQAESPPAAPPSVAASSPPATAAPAAPPPPYSLPWQLRPVAAANVIRSDTAVTFYDNPAGESASTIASTLLLSYKVLPRLAPIVRLAYVHNSPGSGADSGNAFVNPLVGAVYGLDLAPGLKLGLFLGVTIPVGQGGDKAATPANSTAAAAASGINARSGMDNALFAVNFLTVLPGVGLSYSKAGFTAQVEATVLQLTRVRNDDVERDSKRTNFTAGLHLGYFVIPMLSFGGELRYQRWLSDPFFLGMFPERRETATFAFGPRAHFKIGNRWFRPGLAYAQGIDDPMKARKDRILQIDLPFVF